MKGRRILKWIKHYLLTILTSWIHVRLPEHVLLFFCFTAKDSLLGMMLRLVSENQNHNGYSYIVNGARRMILIKNVKKEGGIQNRRMCILRQRYNSMLAVSKKSPRRSYIYLQYMCRHSRNRPQQPHNKQEIRY